MTSSISQKSQNVSSVTCNRPPLSVFVSQTLVYASKSSAYSTSLELSKSVRSCISLFRLSDNFADASVLSLLYFFLSLRSTYPAAYRTAFFSMLFNFHCGCFDWCWSEGEGKQEINSFSVIICHQNGLVGRDEKFFRMSGSLYVQKWWNFIMLPFFNSSTDLIEPPPNLQYLWLPFL